jgi:hypothetical protein
MLQTDNAVSKRREEQGDTREKLWRDIVGTAPNACKFCLSSTIEPKPNFKFFYCRHYLILCAGCTLSTMG